MTSIASESSLGERPRRIKRTKGFVDEIVELIRSDIVSLRIPPDTRISIDALARQLGVSQTPVREALSRLEASGLVNKQRYVGYCSTPQLTPEKLEDLFELRLLLEPVAARFAAQRGNDAELQEFAQFAIRLTANRSARTRGNFTLANYSELHNLIAKATHNSLIAEALAALHVHIYIFRVQLNAQLPREAHAELNAVIRAVTRRQAAVAEAAMRRHIDRSYARLKAIHG